MTRDGSALGFAVRVLLGGALISGLLLYASQALQKSPNQTQQAATTEKIGPAMSQVRAPAVAAVPQKAEPSRLPDAAQPQPAAVPAPVPQAPALQPLSSAPAPVAAVAAPPSSAAPRATPAEPVSLDAEIAVDEPQAEAKPRTARQRGSAGCTSYKSYNPSTQTYRSFDGKIKDCRP